LIGETVGRYEILARLGAGGMGVVYRARDAQLDRMVALKFLPLELTDPEMRERFLREARAASALDHPAICTIYEIGESAHGAPYLAMAHYEGETLRDRLARGPLAPEEALDLVTQIAEGLAAAHARGIVHRDIKPANLFLIAGGRVKILDFGLAFREGADHLTRTGMVLGTPAYMAPEQIESSAVDGRADLWALGVVFHECLTGEPPFRGASDVARMHAVLTAEPPPPSRLRPGLSPAHDAVVASLLVKNPRARTPDAATLLESLRALRGDGSAPAWRDAPTLVQEADAGPRPEPPAENVEAFEHCARGLQAIFQMNAEGFAHAADSFAKALAVDPGYAMAHSGLGQLRAMRYISTTDRADLEAAIAHLMRATALDPELADPHLWLTYSLARLDRFDEAAVSGRRAVELEPGNALARYFLAVAHWLKATLAGAPPDDWNEAARQIVRSTGIAPRNQSAFLVQADLFVRAGQYDAARAAAEHAAEIERSGDFENARFVGGQMQLAAVLARQGQFDAADTTVKAALAFLPGSNHVYTPMFTAWAHCLAAELLFRRRDYSAALPLLRRAREEAESHRSSLALGWPRIRLELLLAAVFGRLHMVREQRTALAAAIELLERRSGYDFSGAWGGGAGELLFELAHTRALAGEREAAFETLERAVKAGWRERPRLESAPGFAPMAGEARLEAIRLQLAELPPLPER
jgi:tetratricopeptide (TPR) repeat protein